MRLTALMAGVALAALMAQPGLAQNQDTTKAQPETSQGGAQQALAQADMDFAKTAAGAGMAEVELGKLATQQAESEPVKQFGQRMVDDHGQANDQLKKIAEQKGIELPQSPPDEAQKAYDDLQQKSGQEFDQAFMETMVEDHHKAVDLFQKEADEGEDADLKSFAESTLPTLQEHLDLAEQAQEQVTAADGKQDTAPAAAAPMPDQQAAGDAQDMGAGATPPEGLKVTNEPMQTKDAGAAPSADQQAATEPMPDQPAAGDKTADQAATEPMPDQPAAGDQTSDQAVTEPMPDQPAAGDQTSDQAATEPMPDQPAADKTAGTPVMANQVIGTEVVNSEGDEVGKITDLVIDADQVQYAVVSVGGFLGIGDKAVAIPLDQLKLGEDQSYLMSGETEDQLKQMPEYEEGQYQPKG